MSQSQLILIFDSGKNILLNAKEIYLAMNEGVYIYLSSLGACMFCSRLTRSSCSVSSAADLLVQALLS